MATVRFTQNLARHVDCPPTEAEGGTVKEVLDRVFAEHPKARGYVLDEAGHVRHHMVVFVDGQMIKDPRGLTDEVGPTSEVYVMQALSGGRS